MSDVLVVGDCLDVLAGMEPDSVDAIVTDPPYNLAFMGRAWDALGGPLTFQEWCATWGAECLRVLKPGGHLAAFGGTRTFHRLTAGLEDAGFEVRDCLSWLYGSGFPKSHDVGKKLDGWEGWGTALKPAWEPIVLCRKPLSGTVAQTVLEQGTGALNIDGCRVEGGRWPANLVLDVESAGMLDDSTGPRTSGSRREGARTGMGFHGADGDGGPAITGSTGGPSRFFYCAKAPRSERTNDHPTVKPLALMRWLVRLVTPPGGVVLDPFAGSGTTGEAALLEGFTPLLIERDADNIGGINARIDRAKGGTS